VVTLAAIIAAGVVYYGQLTEMQTANNLTQQALNRAARDSAQASKDTQAALNETRRSNRLTAESVRIASDSLDFTRKQQRAWVVAVVRGNYTFAVGKETEVQIQQFNSGKVPALNALTRYDIRQLPFKPQNVPTDLFAKYPLSKTNRPALIAPDDSISVSIRITPQNTEALSRVAGLREAFVIYGEISYTDQFSTKGTSGFCRIYSPEYQNFEFCPNVADWAK
jgi:hypothetical protein